MLRHIMSWMIKEVSTRGKFSYYIDDAKHHKVVAMHYI